MESSEPAPTRRKRWYWILGLVLALLTFEVVHAVRHRFFQVELVHARVDVRAIDSVLEEYADAHSKRYPPDLIQLVTPDESGKCWLEGYNGKVPLDPWKHEYRYQPPTPGHPTPRVLSFGSDGLPGGEGDAADLDSDDLR
jgi:general secretion pathway protein G